MTIFLKYCDDRGAVWVDAIMKGDNEEYIHRVLIESKWDWDI